MDGRLVQLSKTVSHALRHQPQAYGLTLDEEGWVRLDSLLAALRQKRRDWAGVSQAHIEQIMAESDKQRFEISDGRIRAFYGHSVPTRVVKEPAIPPEILYHGTSDKVLNLILQNGLTPMRRQYVHLSAEKETAMQVAWRHGGRPVLLEVLAGEAHRQNVAFYLGNDMVWLADQIPPQFLRESY